MCCHSEFTLMILLVFVILELMAVSVLQTA